MTTAVETAFVDTNVWVFAMISTAPLHSEARRWLDETLVRGTHLVTSPQVLREYLVVVTRGVLFAKTLTSAQAVRGVNAILAHADLLDETQVVSAKLCELVERYQVKGKSIHDANVVATMLVHGVTHLLTYNPTDFQRFTEIALGSTLS